MKADDEPLDAVTARRPGERWRFRLTARDCCLKLAETRKAYVPCSLSRRGRHLKVSLAAVGKVDTDHLAYLDVRLESLSGTGLKTR